MVKKRHILVKSNAPLSPEAYFLFEIDLAKKSSKCIKASNTLLMLYQYPTPTECKKGTDNKVIEEEIKWLKGIFDKRYIIKEVSKLEAIAYIL